MQEAGIDPGLIYDPAALGKQIQVAAGECLGSDREEIEI